MLSSPKVGDAPAVEVSFRYNVAPAPNLMAPVFRPNPLEEGSEEVGRHVLGALFHGSYHKCVRNDLASVVWEVLSLGKVFWGDLHDKFG